MGYRQSAGGVWQRPCSTLCIDVNSLSTECLVLNQTKLYTDQEYGMLAEKMWRLGYLISVSPGDNFSATRTFFRPTTVSCPSRHGGLCGSPWRAARPATVGRKKVLVVDKLFQLVLDVFVR